MIIEEGEGEGYRSVAPHKMAPWRQTACMTGAAARIINNTVLGLDLA